MPAIVFDMDGVLIDSERLVLKAWKYVGEELALPDLEPLFYKAIGTTHAHTATLFADAFGEDFDYIGFRDKVKSELFDILEDREVSEEELARLKALLAANEPAK